MIVSLAMCGSIFAQYESHWPDFYYPNFESQTPFVAAIEIDGVIVTADYPGWDALEIAFFVGDECRGAGVAFGDYTPAVNYLYNGYVETYGDPFPVIDGAPVYYDNANEEFTVRMYDHLNGIEYNECTVTLEGAPFVLLTGVDNDQGWFDPENPIILHFTSSAADCKILVDADHETWVEDFEGYDITTTLPERWTGVLPDCWYVAEQYTGTADTLPQVYEGFNSTEDGQYSLRMHFRYMLAMPELDESVDLSKVRMSMYVRQPYYKYKLQIGVMTDLEDESTFVPVAVVNNSTKSLTYFECGFGAAKNITGPGRYIVFKNIGGSEGDLYCTNYLDDITLTYVADECELTINDLPYTENFEDYTSILGETNVEPYCWEVVMEDAAIESVSKPQLYSHFNTTEGGLYTLRMKNRCVYAGPVLGDDINVNDLTMTFQLRQPKSIYRLQVGLVDEQNNFTPLKTIKCTGTDMQEFTLNFGELMNNLTEDVVFPSRIAFRNTLVPGAGMDVNYLDYSYNYIDDIVLDLTSRQRIGESENGSVESDLDNIVVYPNPTTGKLYIDAIDVQKVECYNQMGQLVGMYNNARDIDLGSLAEGVYTLRVTVPQGVTVCKVVKQ